MSSETEFALHTAIQALISISAIHVQAMPGCVPVNTPASLRARSYWAPIVIMESIMFGLACVKVVEHSFLKRTGDPPPAMVVLLRDSIVYYAGSLSVVLTNLLLSTFGDVSSRLPLRHRFTHACAGGFG